MKTNKDKIIEILKSEVESKVDYENLDNSTSLMRQGVDSLDFNSVLLTIEELYEIEIPDEDIPNLDSVDNLVNYINSK